MSNIITSLMPMYFILKHTGLLSFRFDVATQSFVSTTVAMYVAVFLNLIVTAGYALRIFVHQEEMESRFGENLLKFYIFVDVTKNLTVIMSAFVFKEESLLLWKNLIFLERDFLRFGIKLNYTAVRYSGVTVLAVYAALKAAFTLWMALAGSFKFHLEFIIPFCIIQLGDLLYFVAKAYYLTLLYIFQDYLKKIARSTAITSFSATDIPKIKKLCSQLCTMKGTFNKILSPNTVMFIAKITAELILHLYSIVSKFYDSRNTKAIIFNLDVSIQFILDSFFMMAVIISPAYIYSKSAASLKRSLRNIRIYNGNPAIARNIKSFSLQLMHEDFKITAGGLFNIDLSLAYMIVGALTTYITIIVQFDVSYFK